MGILDWFRRRRRLATTTWLDEPSRVRGFCRQVRADLDRGQHVVVVAHFPAGLVEVGQQLATNGIAFSTLARWQPADTLRLASPPPHVVAVLARSLPYLGGAAPKTSRATAAPAVQVRACELHLLAAENERVRHFTERLPIAAAASASVSFDSPHMAKILSPAMRAMMNKLGMDGDSPIQNSMVDSALRRAMAKLEKKVTGNRAADSLAEWMRLNLQD